MMEFKAIQKTFNFTQTNNGHIDDVFPLLCPVREADWLCDWEYKMIYSKSGLIEENCVFLTPYEDGIETIWHVTQHDKQNYKVEFVRVTPTQNVVRINIQLKQLSEKQISAEISYQYTALNQKQNEFIETELEGAFKESMLWWEKAINHYLKTGEMLRK